MGVEIKGHGSRDSTSVHHNGRYASRNVYGRKGGSNMIKLPHFLDWTQTGTKPKSTKQTLGEEQTLRLKNSPRLVQTVKTRDHNPDDKRIRLEFLLTLHSTYPSCNIMLTLRNRLT